MPQFSAFTPYGMLEFSSKPSHGERVYQEMLRNAGVEDNVTPTGNLASELYADAMLSARVLYTLERGGNQSDPLLTQEKLAQQELEHGVTPPPNATLGERRRELARIKRLRPDGRLGTIAQSLNDLLGDKLSFYRTVDFGELPLTIGTYPPGALLVDGNTPVRILRSTTQVSTTGAVTWVKTEFVTGSVEQLVQGQKILVNASDNARAEVVEVVDVEANRFTAVFAQPHDAGVILTTGQHPIITSDKRRHIIVLKDPWHLDTATRVSIAETMRRSIKGTAVWHVWGESAVGQAGTFKVGQGLLGATPIGLVS